MSERHRRSNSVRWLFAKLCASSEELQHIQSASHHPLHLQHHHHHLHPTETQAPPATFTDKPSAKLLTANLISSTFTPFVFWKFEEPALERRWHVLCLTPDQLKPLMTAVGVCLWPPRLSEGLQGRSGRSKDTNQ